MPEAATRESLLRDLLGDGADPVAVFLLAPGQEDGVFAAFEPVRGHRYCQALMKARHGEPVLLEADGLSCPAAAAAFGFRALPAQLANGKGLVGFGIAAESAVGARMFAGMPRLAAGSIAAIALCPLRVAPRVPRRSGGGGSAGSPDVAPAGRSERPRRRAAHGQHRRSPGNVRGCDGHSAS